MPVASYDNHLATLVAHLRKRDRLRVWSIIITMFGDAILPRGGKVWLSTLIDVCAHLGIEAGSVRAAMSRLAQDGWVLRERQGRKSLYSLSDRGREEFLSASNRIYAPLDRHWDGKWAILIISEEAGEERDLRRTTLRSQGFGAVGPTIFIRPDLPDSPGFASASRGDFLFRADLADPADLASLGTLAWDLSGLDASYQAFEQLYAPLVDDIERAAAPDPLCAIALRTMLIHDFRRLVLRDPMLPEALVGSDWIGFSCRKNVAKLYHFLLEFSEVWLDLQDSGINPAGENIDKSITRRFYE